MNLLRPRRFMGLSAGFLAMTAAANAYGHTGLESAVGFLPGAAHPLTGLDHLLAIVAVGLWAGQRGGKAIWLAPLAFLAVMACGGFLGMAGVSLPLAERGIMASLLVLGVLVAAAARLPLVATTAVVGVFAICHGHAHGAEMPAAAQGALYGLGFLSSTAGLLLAGILAARVAERVGAVPLVRWAGGAIAGCGLYLFIG
jgi:urease accessory protein